MRRDHPYASHVRFFLLLTLLGSISALCIEISTESNYLITSHARPDAGLAHHSATGKTTALALK